jgi:hypothetical protein
MEGMLQELIGRTVGVTGMSGLFASRGNEGKMILMKSENSIDTLLN